MQITVLGAAGGAGQAIVHELASRGHDVVAASRSAEERPWPVGIAPLATDLTDPGQLAAACKDAEVVVMAAQVPYSRWDTELADMVERAASAAAVVGARFVMVDNLYAYGSPGTPMSEATPEAATTRKGQLRAAIGQRLLARHHAGELRVAIGRFADYYGPYDGSSLLNQLMIQPGVAGKRVRTFIADDQPHTFHYLLDAARGFATLVEQPEADGAIWILPAAPATTQAALVGHLGDALGAPVRSSRVSPAMLWVLGLFSAEMREAREVVPQFDRAYETDASAFESTFGPIEVTPHDQAIAATVAWGRAVSS
ncbi:MAG: NAD-dependent epimerase/dehydratase family protein [Nitriliruptor sp.]|nr:MAG: NAD-dependent epimerase/dehydratase family protein [Nitriliruptor sp.]